jgi:5-oxoprolinase (ATP-hydrolysing) subunit A
MISVDLNCDMGESCGTNIVGNDAGIMPYVSSVNIACGFHGGDPSVMQHTVKMAINHGVAVGAHPSFHDREGFGRREMNMSEGEIYDLIIYQVSALAGIVKVSGGKMHHVKPHGALYNMAARDRVYAKTIAKAIVDFDATLIFYGLSGSEMIRAGMSAGLMTCSEVFADRNYQDDGSLMPRTKPNALITDSAAAVKQVIRMVSEKTVLSANGKVVPIEADTICIHGDGAHAVGFSKAIHEALLKEGVAIKAYPGI